MMNRPPKGSSVPATLEPYSLLSVCGVARHVQLGDVIRGRFSIVPKLLLEWRQ